MQQEEFPLGGPVTSLLTADGQDAVAHGIAQILSMGELVTETAIRCNALNIPSGRFASLDLIASFNISSVGVSRLGLVERSD